MPDLIRTIKQHLLARQLRSEDLAKQATAAKRAAGDIRRQAITLSSCLSSSERRALDDAATILDAASEAAGSAKRQRKTIEQDQERRRLAAVKAVEQAFADVNDAGGLIVLLATTGSLRTTRAPDGSYLLRAGAALRESDFSRDAKEIQTHERREAIEHYAWRIATDSDKDVTAEANALRVRFDERRAAVEAKHPALIERLANEMKTKE